ncbi:MAG: acetylornithine deacetylase [Solirubrobacteraceae bacterium]
MSPSDPEALLASLVSYPTVAGQPNKELVEFVRTWLAGYGVQSTIIPSSSRPDGLNIHAVIGPSAEPGVVLSAHTDVVSVDGQAWQSDPFQLTRDGDRLYGRGTADMKGFVAAVLAIVPYAVTRPLRRPVHIALSCDEELGCRGVGTLLDLLDAAPTRPALCIVGEPTEMRVADRHKGKVGMAVSVHGRAGHSSSAPSAVNAVTYAARLIIAIDELGVGLARAATDPGFGVPHATLSIGPIRGGVSTNIVPDACSFEFELRYLPGQDPEPILDEVQARAGSLEDEMRASALEAGIEFRRATAYPPLAAMPLPATLPSPLQGAPIAVDFGTEAGLYRERLGIPVLVCGPGNMAQAHRANEYLEVDQLGRACGFLRSLVDDLCVA